MPFTLAHPVATLPLWKLSKRRLDLPALAVGATIPDISYFVALQPMPNIGHSLIGIVLEGLPSGFVLLLIGRYWLWQPVRSLLPGAIATRVPIHCPYDFLPLPRLVNLALSIAIGALTHIVWDNFTHAYGWGVQRFSGLSATIAGLPIYKALQYGCGLLGFAILLLLLTQFVAKQPRQYRPSQLSRSWKRMGWGAIATINALTIATAILVESQQNLSSASLSSASLSSTIVRGIIGSVSGLFLGLCLYALTFWIHKIFRR